MVEVSGTVKGGFESVAERFRSHFETAGEVGASLCVWHQGEVVLDLWGGVRHEGSDEAWTPDTLANVFSVTKGMVGTLLLVLEDAGEVDLDSPISQVWPEFAAAGKASITWRDVANHRSGVVALDTPLSLEDLQAWTPVEDALIAQAPLWEPGTAQGYHAVTYGIILRCALQRLTGRSIGALLAQRVAAPLGADIHLGLADEHHDRVATLATPGGLEAVRAVGLPLIRGGSMESNFFRNVLLRPGSPGSRAVRNPRELGGFSLANFNRPEVRRLELPWANGHASARGLARMYAALANGGAVDGVRLVSEAASRRPVPRQSWSELDLTMRKPMGFSQGFVKEQTVLFSPNTSWFGHPGIGGSLGCCDPDEGLALAYVMNRMRPQVRSPTALALSREVYRCLGREVVAA